MPKTACSKPLPMLLAIVTLSLSACATAPSERAVICQPVVTYDKVFQSRLADELQRLPPGTATERAMADYVVMRDQARACRPR